METSLKSVKKRVAVMRREEHARDIADPCYRAGYEAHADAENPFPYDTDRGVEMAQIACIRGELSQKQMDRLVELRKYLDGIPWQRWEMGHYMRWNFTEEFDELTDR
jgi:hypothetical protein